MKKLVINFCQQFYNNKNAKNVSKFYKRQQINESDNKKKQNFLIDYEND